MLLRAVAATRLQTSLLQEASSSSRLYETFKSVEVMEQQGVPISRDLAYQLLLGCAKSQDLELDMRVESLLNRSGLDLVPVLSDHLIRLFASDGSLINANQAFCKVTVPSNYTWNTIISGHTKLGTGEMALQLYNQMHHDGIKPDAFTFSSISKACIGYVEQGRLIHEQFIGSGLQQNVVIGNALIDMYVKCGNLQEAFRVFDRLPSRDVISWNIMIAGYALHDQTSFAQEYFDNMELEGVEKDATTWGTIIAGYVQCDKGLLALECFKNMQHEGRKPTKVIFLSILRACCSLGMIEQGRCIHEQILESGLQSDMVVGTALVDMYAKCGSLDEAQSAFSRLLNRDVVSWNAMIAGYAQHGEGCLALACLEYLKRDGISPNVVTWGTIIEGFAQEGEGLLALKCYERMQEEGLKADKFAFSSVLKACGSIGAIEKGICIHNQIIECGLQRDAVVASSLVDMYIKCGNLEDVCKNFEKLPHRDVVIWSAIIGGYAQCGDLRLVGQCLQGMHQEGIKPNEVTFIAVLAACSHAGSLHEGYGYFKLMREEYGVIPDARHYVCMVDLLGRAGYLNEAESLLQTIQPSDIGCASLLVACRTYGNVELAKECFDRIVQSDPQYASGYVLMSGIYSDACMWKDAAKLEDLRHQRGAWKKPAKAWIEVKKNVHEFVVGDRNHQQSETIYAVLKSLMTRMKEEGFLPKLNLVLQERPDKDKEDVLCGHCEKLAIVFGLVSTPPGTTIRVTKNLRVCTDCHNASKIISRLERRQIIIKDPYRRHHFVGGLCSCDDYH